MGLSSLFKKKTDKEPKKEIESAPAEVPVKVEKTEATKTVAKKAPAKSAPEKESEPKRPVKKAAEKEPAKKAAAKTPSKKTAEKEPAKKTASKTAEKKPAEKKAASKTSSKKTAEKEPAKKTAAKKAEKEPAKKTASKSTAKKASAKKDAEEEKKGSTASAIPPELKTLNKQLKAFAERSRMQFNSETANAVFTEYMAKVFRDLRYRMLMIKDANEGLMTMLGNTTDDISVKDKIVVKCVYMKKGSVTPLCIEQVQNDSAFYHADETWCVTTTDFTDAAVRKARKPEAKVKLFDGKKLYKEFISELEKD